MRITKHITAIKEGLGNYLKSLEKENEMKFPEVLPDGTKVETKGSIGLKLPYDAAKDLFNLLNSLKEFRCQKALDRNQMMIFYPSDCEERVKKDILMQMAEKLYEEGYVRFYQYDISPSLDPNIAQTITGSIIIVDRKGEEPSD